MKEKRIELRIHDRLFQNHLDFFREKDIHCVKCTFNYDNDVFYTLAITA